MRLVRNVGAGLKYPYKPFYGEFSPRVSFAWNPHYSDGVLGKLLGNGKTVVRGGYSRIYGRLNGVDLVLVPLLGPGLLQGVTCVNPISNGTCGDSGSRDPGECIPHRHRWSGGAPGVAEPQPAAAVLSRAAPIRNRWTRNRSIRSSVPIAPTTSPSPSSVN